MVSRVIGRAATQRPLGQQEGSFRLSSFGESSPAPEAFAGKAFPHEGLTYAAGHLVPVILAGAYPMLLVSNARIRCSAVSNSCARTACRNAVRTMASRGAAPSPCFRSLRACCLNRLPDAG